MTERAPSTRRSDMHAAVLSFLWAGGLTTAIAMRIGHISGMLHIGGPNAIPGRLPAGVKAQPMFRAYDGMFFYRLALAPFSTREWDHGIRLDAPALRASRITYPLLARSIGWGDPSRTVVAMVAVNVVAAVVLGVLATRHARAAGRPWQLGLLVLVLPGVTYGLALSLADVLALTLVVGALLAHGRDRWAVAAVLLALAVLTRESTLLWVGALAVATLAREDLRRRPLAWSVVALPAVVFVAWQAAMARLWHGSGLGRSGGANLGPPFAGLVASAQSLLPRDGSSTIRFLLLGLMVGVLGLAIVSVARSSPFLPPLAMTVALVAGAVLLVSLTQLSFSNAPNFGRAATEGLLAALLVSLWARGRAATLSLTLMAVGGIALAGWTIWASTPLA